VSRVPWWGVVSAAAAPVLLVGGWTLAAARQVPAVDPAVETISALAAVDATDRWIMTAALTGLGACHLVTALALRPAARPGRAVLALGGAATVAVAALPLPADGGSTPHAVAAAVAFLALAVWPAAGARRAAPTLILSRPVSAAAAAVLLGLVGWFALELTGGARVGRAERVAAAAQAAWPLVVVLGLRARRR
jgi:hypothetical membrane protein